MKPTSRSRARRLWRIGALLVLFAAAGFIAALPWVLALPFAQRQLKLAANRILAPSRVEFASIALSWNHSTSIKRPGAPRCAGRSSSSFRRMRSSTGASRKSCSRSPRDARLADRKRRSRHRAVRRRLGRPLRDAQAGDQRAPRKTARHPHSERKPPVSRPGFLRAGHRRAGGYDDRPRHAR